MNKHTTTITKTNVHHTGVTVGTIGTDGHVVLGYSGTPRRSGSIKAYSPFLGHASLYSECGWSDGVKGAGPEVTYETTKEVVIEHLLQVGDRFRKDYWDDKPTFTIAEVALSKSGRPTYKYEGGGYDSIKTIDERYAAGDITILDGPSFVPPKCEPKFKVGDVIYDPRERWSSAPRYHFRVDGIEGDKYVLQHDSSGKAKDFKPLGRFSIESLDEVYELVPTPSRFKVGDVLTWDEDNERRYEVVAVGELTTRAGQRWPRRAYSLKALDGGITHPRGSVFRHEIRETDGVPPRVIPPTLKTNLKVGDVWKYNWSKIGLEWEVLDTKVEDGKGRVKIRRADDIGNRDGWWESDKTDVVVLRNVNDPKPKPEPRKTYRITAEVEQDPGAAMTYTSYLSNRVRTAVGEAQVEGTKPFTIKGRVDVRVV